MYSITSTPSETTVRLKPTILAIQSKRTVGGADETIYYPIQFTAADAGNTIEPGNALHGNPYPETVT